VTDDYPMDAESTALDEYDDALPPAWRSWAYDPGLRAVVVLALIAIAGFVTMVFAYRGVAKTIYVPLQVPWILSGGFAGLCLVSFAFAAWHIHIGRRDDAVYRQEFERFAKTTAELAERMRVGQLAIPQQRRRRPAKKTTRARSRRA
jgi:hypothetical protein